MRLLIIILSIVCCGIAPSQETTIFAPLGATWYYSEWSFQPYPPLFTFVSEGDTIINGNHSRILQAYSSDSGVLQQVDSLNKYVFTSGNQVYYWVEDNFYLLFDFDALPGDTIYSRVEYFPVFMGCASDFSNGPFDFSYVVDSLGSVMIDGVELRVQHVTSIRNSGESNWSIDGPIVERIGLYSYSNFWWGRGDACILGGFPGILRCYEDQEIYYKNPFDQFDFPCAHINELETITEELNPLYPNPAEEFIIIPVNAEIINLYHASGEKIGTYKNQDSIDLKNIPPGSYILTYYANKKWKVNKFIKF